MASIHGSPIPPRPEAPLHIDPSRPAYRVINPKGYFSARHTLQPPGTPIYLKIDEEPNEGLLPLNDLAFQAMIKFLNKLDEHAAKVAALTGRSYMKKVDLFMQQWTQREQQIRDMEVIGASPMEVGAPIFPVLGAGQDAINAVRQVPVMTGMPQASSEIANALAAASLPRADTPAGATPPMAGMPGQYQAAVTVRPGPIGQPAAAPVAGKVDALNALIAE